MAAVVEHCLLEVEDSAEDTVEEEMVAAVKDTEAVSEEDLMEEDLMEEEMVAWAEDTVAEVAEVEDLAEEDTAATAMP